VSGRAATGSAGVKKVSMASFQRVDGVCTDSICTFSSPLRFVWSTM
jgi:hypothetical protein